MLFVTLLDRNCHLHPLLLLLLDGSGKDRLVLVHSVEAGRLTLAFLGLAPGQR